MCKTYVKKEEQLSSTREMHAMYTEEHRRVKAGIRITIVALLFDDIESGGPVFCNLDRLSTYF